MTNDDAEARLARLLGFLGHDCQNLALATDAADAALAVDKCVLALELLKPFDVAGTLDGSARNIAGIAAMRNGDQEMAQRHFEALLDEFPDDKSVRFNLAWSKALIGDYPGSRKILGNESQAALPQAAMLDLQLHHHLSEFDAAEEKLADYLDRFPDYAPLQAAVSVLAMDMDKADLARACAERGGLHPDALSTLGALELGEQNFDAARDLFVRSIEMRLNNPRANVGFGLVELASGNSASALPYLDRGADQFCDHLGSWLAAGWGHLLAGDIQTARERFETTLDKDENFGEAHGSLAVLDALAGDMIAAGHRAGIALRLDRESFSAALATMIVATSEGDGDKAQRIFDLAAGRPLTPDGKTLAELLARIAL